MLGHACASAPLLVSMVSSTSMLAFFLFQVNLTHSACRLPLRVSCGPCGLALTRYYRNLPPKRWRAVRPAQPPSPISPPPVRAPAVKVAYKATEAPAACAGARVNTQPTATRLRRQKARHVPPPAGMAHAVPRFIQPFLPHPPVKCRPATAWSSLCPPGRGIQPAGHPSTGVRMPVPRRCLAWPATAQSAAAYWPRPTRCRGPRTRPANPRLPAQVPQWRPLPSRQDDRPRQRPGPPGRRGG